MTTLAEKPCLECQGGTPPLTGHALQELHRELDHDWQIMNNHHLEKTYNFKDFREALTFTDRVGEVAETAGHHPDIYLSWGKVKVTIWTHKVNGLTESDFILAARIEALDQRKNT